MKKIIFGILVLYVLGTYQVGAVSSGSYIGTNSSLVISSTGFTIQKISGNIVCPFSGVDLNTINFVMFSDFIASYKIGSSVSYCDTGTWSSAGVYQGFANIYKPSPYLEYGFGYYNTTTGSRFLVSNDNGANVFSSVYTGPFTTDVVYNMQNFLFPASPTLSCTSEIIPDTQIINIQPTSTGAIVEYIENPTDKEYGYSTSLSGDNPLLVSLLNANSVLGWDYFSYQTGSLSFKTPLTENTFLAFSSSSNIEYFKMLGTFGNVDIYTYLDDAKTIKQIFENVNLNDWVSDFGFPVGGTPLVVLKFDYSPFTKNIDTLQVYSIGPDDTKEVEICYNEDDNEYLVDGEIYTGNPYTDLVGDPEPTQVSFTSSGYLFYSNGFCLQDFLPFPNGGSLFFDIKNPLGKLSTTYPLKNTGLYKYGIGTCTKITTNYHQEPGKYYVKARYLYNGVYYDVHENFFTYDITSPETIISSENIWVKEKCGTDTGVFAGITNFFDCLSKSFEEGSKNFSDFFAKIQSFFGALLEIGNTNEFKGYGFLFGIPQASADFSISDTLSIQEPSESNILQKFKNFGLGVLFFLFLMLLLLAFISLKKKND